MPPRLKQPCRLPITVRPLSASSAVPSALIDTSNRLIAAPKTTPAGSSQARPGQCKVAASKAPMTAEAIITARRAPSVPITRPAMNSDSTAPIAIDSSTTDRLASVRSN